MASEETPEPIPIDAVYLALPRDLVDHRTMLRATANR